MKFNKALPIIFMVLISLFAIGAVTASDADNMADVMEVSADDNEMEIIEVDEKQNMNEVLSAGEDNTQDVQMNLTVENITYGERIPVNVNVSDKTGTIDFTVSGVEIEIDGNYISKAPINPTTGVSGGSFNLTNLNVGTHYVKATLLNGTEKILTKDTFFNIEKAIPSVNVTDVIVNAYENVTVPIYVTDKNGKGISGEAIVTIVWQSDSLSKRVSVVDGSANAFFDFTDIIGIISSMSMGDMMGAMMGGDSGGGMDWGSMFSGNGSGFNWSQMSQMNWTEMFNGSGSGSGMNWEEMFSGNGTGSGNMMEGMVSVSFENLLLPGNYNVTTTFLPNRNYDTANATSSLIVTYLEDVVYFADISSPKKIGDNATVTITVLDKFSRPIPNIVVSVILDDKQMPDVTLNENGTAKTTFSNLVNGNHNLVLQSTVNGTLTNKSFDFDVQLAKANVTIVAKDITVTAVDVNVDGKIGKYFTATIKDELGNVLNNKTVQISINNHKYDVPTDKEGVAKLQINIAKAGTYTATVASLADDTYNGAFDIAKVTVNKQTAKLSVAKKTYKATAKTKKFTATFKSAKNKALKGKKITFKVNGKTYTAKTNAKGVATVNVKLTKKGTYKVTAKFAGDNTYKAISKTGKLILK